MEFEYSYQFTEKASSDLDEILYYISNELDNPVAAQNFIKKIFEKIDVVRTFPDSGSLVVNEFLSDKNIRKFIVGNYIVYYKTNYPEKMINIVRIIYGKRNQDEVFKS